MVVINRLHLFYLAEKGEPGESARPDEPNFADTSALLIYRFKPVGYTYFNMQGGCTLSSVHYGTGCEGELVCHRPKLGQVGGFTIRYTAGPRGLVAVLAATAACGLRKFLSYLAIVVLE